MIIPRAETLAGLDPPETAAGLAGPDRGHSGEASCSYQALGHVWTVNIPLAERAAAALQDQEPLGESLQRRETATCWSPEPHHKLKGEKRRQEVLFSLSADPKV